MKRRINLLSLFIIAILVVLIDSSCTSGKKALERGNYYESVMLSVSRLQRNPSHKKSIITLESAYPLSVDYYEENIRNLKAREDRNKWRGILDSYTRVNNMYEAIRKSPGALKVIPNPKNYYNELATAKENAAEESYQLGLAELNKRTVESGRVAYHAFKETDAYVPGYKDVINKIEEAYWMGTTKVLINPIPVTNARVQLSANFFEDKIHEYLKNEPINEFTRFMTEADLQTLGLQPDQVLQLQFDEFTIGEVSTVERQIDQVKDSVVVGSVNASSLVGGNTGSISPVQRNQTVNTNTQNNTNTNTTNTTNNTNTTNTTNNTTNTTNNTNTTNTTNNTNNTNTTTTSSNTGNNSTGTNTNVSTNTNSSSNNATSTGSTSNNSGTEVVNTKKDGKYTIQVCHSTNNGNQILSINENALSAHLGHGDKLFSCDSKSNTKVRICHKAGDNKTQTLEVSVNALKAHLDHGDVLGGCDGSTFTVETENKSNNQKPGNSAKPGNKGNNGNNNDAPYLVSTEFNSYNNEFAPLPFAIDTNINVYNTVRAKVYIFEKTVRSYGTLDMKILDANTGSLISAEKLTGEYIWKSQWGYFNGDERALTEEQRNIVGQRELQPPNEQDMFMLFTQPIFNQLMAKMKRFYN